MRRVLATIAVSLVLSTVATGDTFDQDGLGDLFFVDSGGTLQWAEASGGDNTLGAPVVITTGKQMVTAGFFDPDARGDLFVGQAGGGLDWYENDGTDNGVGFSQNMSANAYTAGSIADWDGEGNADFMATRTDFPPNGVTIWFDNNGTDNQFTDRGGVSGDSTAVAMGDLDSDGFGDILIGKSTGLFWLEGTGSDDGAAFRGAFSILGITDIAFGNLDGDAATDMVVVRNNQLVWFEGNGDNAVPLNQQDLFDADVSAVAIGDIDGDGVQELVVGHSSSGISWYEYDAGSELLELAGGTGLGASGVLDLAIIPGVIPEPGSLALFAMGALAMIYRRR